MKQDEAEKLARDLMPRNAGIAVLVPSTDLKRLCHAILSGDMKREIAHDEDSTLVTKMARAIWKQMNFRGGDPRREWDSLTPDMQQPILDSCRVGLATVKREIENAAYERVKAEALKRVSLRSDTDYGDGAQDMANEIYKAARALITPAKTADTEG